MAKNNLREALSALVTESGVTVTKVEPGFRALARAAAPKKGGRPAKEGERYPGGKLKPEKIRPTIDPIAPALWDRLRNEIIKNVGDSRFGSEVGRLSMHGELSATQAAAAFRIAGIYGRFERYRDLRRSAASPSYMVASSSIADDNKEIEGITPEMLARSMAEELLDPEQLADLEARVDAADGRFLKLQKFMRVFPANVRAAIELLCVDDRLTNPAAIGTLRNALDEAAVFFRIKAAPKEKKVAYREVAVSRDRKEVVIPDADKTAWLKTLATLRPDLTEQQRNEAYAMTVALKAREVLEREKLKRVGVLSGVRSNAIVSEVDQVKRHVANLMKKRTYQLAVQLKG